MLFFFFWRNEDEKRFHCAQADDAVYGNHCDICCGGLRRVDNTLYQTLYGRETGGIDSAGRKKNRTAYYKKGYRTGNLSELSYELQILESYMGSGVLVINENGEVALASPGFNDEFLGG